MQTKIWSLLSDVIVRGAGTAFVIQVLGAGLGYIMHILLARWLGLSVYGEYVYALAWVSFLAVPAGFGFGTGIIRFIPEYAATQKGGFLKGAIIRSWQIVLLAGIIIGAVGAGTIWGLRMYLDYAPVLVVAMGLVPLHALLRLQVGMGRGLEYMTVAYIPERILRPALIIALIGIWVFVTDDITGKVAVACAIIAYILTCIPQAIAIWRYIPDFALEERPRYQTRRWIKVSLPLLLMSGFLLMLNQTDVVMIGLFDEATGVGVYNAASRTATLVGFVMLAVNAIAAPTISALYTENRKVKMQELATNIAHYIFWPSVLIGIALIGLSGYILALFGSDFTGGQMVLYILVLGNLVNAGAGSVGTFMTMTGHQDYSAYVFGCTAIINIILNLIAIPLFGVIGAAIATSLSMSIWNIWLNWAVVKKLGVRASIIGVMRLNLSKRKKQ